MNNVTITLEDGRKLEYRNGVRLSEVINDVDATIDAVAANYNGAIVPLNTQVLKNGKLKLYTVNDSFGNKIYERGLTFLFKACANEILGNDVSLRIRYSLDRGIFFETDKNISDEEISKIKTLMKEKVNDKIPFTIIDTSMSEALAYFKSIKRYDKVKTLFYNKNNYVTLYKFGDYYNYFTGMLPTDSSSLKIFDLIKIENRGVILRFPSIYDNGKLLKFKQHEKFFESIDEYLKWSKVLNASSVGELNDMIITNKPGDLINMSETLLNYRLQEIAKNIYQNKKDAKVVLLSGPSSSGKTTTARKLSMYLRSGGLNPVPISLDDYFLERDQTPLDENGKYDFESLRAIDVKLFNNQIASLLKGKKVLAPTFDFVEGKKVFNKYLELHDNDILLIEGLHALSSELLKDIPKKNKFKIYVSPLVYLNVDDDNRINQTDIRLLRRMARDYRTRGYSPSQTLNSWKNVRIGEERYVFPYQDEADVIFNTFTTYELAVMKVYVLPLLYQIKEDDPEYFTAIRLIKLLDFILPMPAEDVPQISILREFIGKSYFE